MEDENDRGEQGESEGDKDPVMAKQPPPRAERYEQPRKKRSDGQGDDDKPTRYLHPDPSRTDRRITRAGYCGDPQAEVRQNRTDPADRERKVRRQYAFM